MFSTPIIVFTRSDLRSKQKAFPSWVFWLVFLPLLSQCVCVCVGEAKIGETQLGKVTFWQGIVVFRMAAKKVLFQTHPESFFPSLAFKTPNATCYHSRMYSAFLSFLYFHYCCWNSTLDVYMLYALCGVHKPIPVGKGQRALHRFSPWGNSERIQKTSKFRLYTTIRRVVERESFG